MAIVESVEHGFHLGRTLGIAKTVGGPQTTLDNRSATACNFCRHVPASFKTSVTIILGSPIAHYLLDALIYVHDIELMFNTFFKENMFHNTFQSKNFVWMARC